MPNLRVRHPLFIQLDTTTSSRLLRIMPDTSNRPLGAKVGGERLNGSRDLLKVPDTSCASRALHRQINTLRWSEHASPTVRDALDNPGQRLLRDPWHGVKIGLRRKNIVTVLTCLLLLVVANGAPVLLAYLLGERFASPLDAGIRFFDRRPLLGPSKTIRGVIAAILATALVSVSIGLPLRIGVLVAVWAMIGDLLSSFMKRRLGIPPSSMALGLDQGLESLFPLLAVRSHFGLSFSQILVGVGAFLVVELALSYIFFKLHIRKRPY